jgi:tRNA-2-methylthio-N6-dimethylallyladenosine synthase
VPKHRFADLLTAVARTGIQRVRFLTSHPKYMSDRVIMAIRDSPALCKCINLPFQSGDNEVLKNMRRGYTRERYLEIISSIREAIPDAAITTDVIVGFPGETDDQFENTLSLMREVHFDLVNSAAYSPRPNTPAANWTNQLSEETKKYRLDKLNRLAHDHALERSKRFLGRVQQVLVEDVNIKCPSQLVGRNEHSRLVFFDGDFSELKGKMVNVIITEARAYSLSGKLTEI